MKIVEMQGKSTAEVLSQFKKKYNLSENDFEYDVIQEGKDGFWGLFGGQKAKIKFVINDLNNSILSFLNELSTFTGVNIELLDIKKDEKYIYVNVGKTSESGFMIGKEGRFLDSLQYLLNQIFINKDPKNRNILLDIEGYKERQEKQLFKKAQHVASQVQKTKRSMTMDPMNAAQRRIVHQAIREMTDIRTMTIGEGQLKRIVLSPTNSPKKNYYAKNSHEKK
jgi:spoIIIJ-associated protein